MKIAAHISGEDNSDSSLLALLKIISVAHPESNFVFFVEKRLSLLPNNCKQILITPKQQNKLLLYYWYTFKLPNLLKKEQSDLFINDAGMQCQQFNLPQFLFLHDTGFKKKNYRLYQKQFVKALENATAIFTSEDFIKEKLADNYKISSDKITTINHWINTNAVSSDKAVEAAKDRFTEGQAYFLFPVSAGTQAHVITILKAFSQLKKWLKTSMKMVFLLEGVSENNLVADFKNYKYRDDVRFVEASGENKTAIVQSAFAIIYFADYVGNNVAFDAFQHNVPIIAADNEINRSFLGPAAIFTGIGEKALSEKMQLLYKDELLRSYVIKQASLLLKKYDADTAAGNLYAALNDR